MQDNLVIHDIRIDKDGVWSYRGNEMLRKDIVQLLYRHLKRDHDGRYLIEMGEDREYLDVEDTPYVIKSISLTADMGKDVISLHMPDETVDELDPSTLRVGADNALYGIMSGMAVEARFSRSSYYQLAEHIEQEDGKEQFYIFLNSQRYYIRRNEDVKPEAT